MHGSKSLLVLENGPPASVIVPGGSFIGGWVFLLGLLGTLHCFESSFPCKRIRSTGNTRSGRKHVGLFSLNHFISKNNQSSPKCWETVIKDSVISIGRNIQEPCRSRCFSSQGTWWSWVRTQSSNLLPEFPRRLPLMEFRFLSSRSLFWSLIVSWSRMTTLFMDTCILDWTWRKYFWFS